MYEDDRERNDEDQGFERAETRQQHDQHRAEDPAEIREPDAREMLRARSTEWRSAARN